MHYACTLLLDMLWTSPLPSIRQRDDGHLDDCQNCSVLYFVQQLCTCTHTRVNSL